MSEVPAIETVDASDMGVSHEIGRSEDHKKRFLNGLSAKNMGPHETVRHISKEMQPTEMASPMRRRASGRERVADLRGCTALGQARAVRHGRQFAAVRGQVNIRFRGSLAFANWGRAL